MDLQRYHEGGLIKNEFHIFNCDFWLKYRVSQYTWELSDAFNIVLVIN